MADWRTRLQERIQEAETRRDELMKQHTPKEWNTILLAQRYGLRVENGQMMHPTEDRPLVYREFKQFQVQHRQKIAAELWERNHRIRVTVLTKLHLYHPRYVKHPREDRDITFGEWKHEMHVMMRELDHEWWRMMDEHSIIFRGPQAVDRTLREATIIASHITLYSFRKGLQAVRYSRTHIMPWDRRIMRREGLTEEEFLARKAGYYEATRLLPKSLRLRIKTFMNNMRNSKSK
jgi:hypothetical protein